MIEARRSRKKRRITHAKLRVIGRDNPASPLSGHRRNDSASVTSLHFEGPTRQIQDAYRAADLFVFPSLYDPFANVVLESLACGLPAITTTTNGSSEIITEGEDGYVIEGATDHLATDIAACVSTVLRAE